MKHFEKYTHFQLFTAINIMIYQNIVIKNKYGIDSYVREKSDILFLTESLSSGSEYSIFSYSQHPVIIDAEKYDSIVISNMIENVKNSSTVDEIKMYMAKLPVEYQKIFIENSFESPQTKTSDLIHRAFFPRENPEYTLNKINYCLVNGEWVECVGQPQVDDIKSPYDYEGLYNSSVDKFCIKKKKLDVKDSREISSGKVCTTWKKPDLKIIATHLDIEDYDETDRVTKLCGKLKTFFKDNELLREDDTCGISEKKKKIQ
jgi:hypothetical protein